MTVPRSGDKVRAEARAEVRFSDTVEFVGITVRTILLVTSCLILEVRK